MSPDAAAPWNREPARPDWGIRVPPRKAQSTSRPIRVAPLPGLATIPLDQGHAGSCEPVVAVGQRVLTGQVIGRPGRSGAPVHASISGQVIGIETRPLPGPAGLASTCVVIEGDGQDEWHPECQAPPSPATLAPDEICARIAAAGIVGLGGALFPTAAKLAPAGEPCTLLLNGAECEPYISCDEMLIRDRAAAVLAGARVMMRALGATQCVIAIESDMPDARQALRNALEPGDAGDVGIAVVTAKYPAGGERQLIELVGGREVPDGGLPRDVGYVCQNVGTAAAVADLFASGRPLVSRIVTVTGGGVAAPRNFDVRIGTPVADLIEAAGGYTSDERTLLVGGPMMGFALPADTLPVTKATNCIIVPGPNELSPAQPEYPCIRCGECSDVCPARLMPQALLGAVVAGDRDAQAELGMAACIECGCCDYVCPSHIPLTARFVLAKQDLRQAAAEAERARRAKARSEARDLRLAREHAQRDAELQAQEDRLREADGAGRPAALQELLERVARRERGDGEST